MTLFANILLSVLWLSAPADGTTVPTLREAQKAYLAQGRAERFKALGDAAARTKLAAAGATQEPLRLAWHGDTNAVFRLEVAREGGTSQSFVVSNRTEAYLANLEVGARYRWTVSSEDGAESTNAVFATEAQPPRLLRAEGVLNFRDLGGWTGRNGRRVRQGRILRSAGLRFSARQKDGASLFGGAFVPGGDRVTAAGLATLREEFGVRTDVELRTDREAACMKGSLLGRDVRWVHVPFAAYDFIDNPVRGREPFEEVFRTFLDERNYPILFHCSGGRDRTGTLAFLLGGLLGVDGEDLCRDWEATAFSEADVGFGPDRLKRLLDYLSGLGGATVAEQCEQYALSCGVTQEEIDTFRRIMLEDAP